MSPFFAFVAESGFARILPTLVFLARLSRASATASRSSSNRSLQTSKVIAAEAWPSIRWIDNTDAPDEIANEAAVWRSECGVIAGSFGFTAGLSGADTELIL